MSSWLSLRLAALVVCVLVAPAFAADTTPPSRPVVTDGGLYTQSLTELSLNWTSLDPESPSLFCSVEIRQDSKTGPIVDARTLSCATFTAALFGDLVLQQGKRYYAGVKARNSAGLWSAVGFSDGIRVDVTPPTAPGRPTEGSPDVDWDGDGAYAIAWPSASDLESKTSAYELQERSGVGAPWQPLASTGTTRTVTVTGRLDRNTYCYQVRARNGSGLWSAWSASSDCVTIDTTPPTAPLVTLPVSDVTIALTDTLLARWQPSGDPESGILAYEYTVREGSPSGSAVTAWASTKATQASPIGLALVPGRTYFLVVRARNRAGLYSTEAASRGWTILGDTEAPLISSLVVDETTLSGMAVRWTTTEPATSEVDFGPTTGYGQTVSNSTPTTTHQVNLTGLLGMTTYHLRVRSVDAAGNVGESGDVTVDTARPGPSLVSVIGRQLVVQPRGLDGTLGAATPYVMRCVNWSPAGPGTNTSPTDPNNAGVRRPEFGAWYTTDIPMFVGMNVNCVRLFIDPGVDESLGPVGLRVLDELYRKGIMVVMTVDDAINDTGRAQQVVSYYRDHPSILMWSLGSEWNHNRYFGVAASVLDAAQRTQTAAALVKALDANHPVASSYGEVSFGGPDTQLAATQSYINVICTSVDIWSLNVYRGQTFGALWSQWQSLTSKPVFLGEFGADAFNAGSGTVDESAQAEWDVSLWNDIARNLSAVDPAKVALGGAVFEWNDEWWKVPPAGSQEIGGWASPGFPDGMGNEEWFGVVDINRGPRLVYAELARVFDPAYVPPPRIAVFKAVSRGAAAAEWPGQYGIATFLQDSTILSSRTGGGGGGRGFNVAAVDAATGVVLEPGRNFDTWGTRTTGAAMRAMIGYVNGLPDNTLILLAVADDAGLNLDNSCTRINEEWVDDGVGMLGMLGSVQIQNYCFRDSWAMAVVKGEGTARAEQQGSGIEVSAPVPLTTP